MHFKKIVFQKNLHFGVIEVVPVYLVSDLINIDLFNQFSMFERLFLNFGKKINRCR